MTWTHLLASASDQCGALLAIGVGAAVVAVVAVALAVLVQLLRRVDDIERRVRDDA